jgi:hypothetical protein
MTDYKMTNKEPKWLQFLKEEEEEIFFPYVDERKLILEAIIDLELRIRDVGYDIEFYEDFDTGEIDADNLDFQTYKADVKWLQVAKRHFKSAINSLRKDFKQRHSSLSHNPDEDPIVDAILQAPDDVFLNFYNRLCG